MTEGDKRRSRLAANFPNMGNLEQSLKETHKTSTDFSDSPAKTKPSITRAMPGGSEGEPVHTGTRFYYNATDPGLDGKLLATEFPY